MPRRAAKVDDNHREIVGILKKVGCTVQSLAAVGNGCPDILVGWTAPSGAKRNVLMEIKDGGKPEPQRRLTKGQREWHDRWQGQVTTVLNPDEALKAIGFAEWPL